MSSVPGWYPDPSGSSDLRLWDGAAWTEQTRSPAAPEAIPVQPAPHLEPQRVLASAGGSSPSSAPSSYYGTAVPAAVPLGGDGRGSSGLRPAARRSHRKLIVGIALGAAAIVAVVAVPMIIASSGSIYDRTSTAMPKAVAGYKQVIESSANVSSDFRTSGPFASARVGVYASTDRSSEALLAVTKTKTDAASIPSALSVIKTSGYAHDQQGHPSDLSGFVNQPPGALGGQMQCGIFASDGQQVSGCIFVDQGAQGMLMVNSAVVDMTLMHELRAAIEKRS